MILTSSWFTPLPADHLHIGISRGVPRGMKAGYKRYLKLNPGPWFNSCRTPKEYFDRYYGEILKPLDSARTVEEILQLADGKIPVLVCFESIKPESGWCDRALVSTWLHDELGMEVCEFGHEHLGHGWQHPKLDPALRKPLAP
ncbi:conserved protein of unknown function [Candidatus Filomicrobium marinum]|uniref:DUF488 domain-containing protein n=1 Tax=Candidatus Filomicrobium marinum TaxID=1608628 RepID=A0A0D6JFW9_9HYPH|nr:hypothetical protein [Candidatus Filomicrobium marinum]CFX24458.1 conserved protein of unknown function [Candidatus Filomicrobium marinum]CPR19170.1 conserved protein of unknown function [Candidatus Filomicrobium marinum]